MNVIALVRTHNSDWIINDMLTNLQWAVDGIIIHDDNSTDKTVPLCKTFDKVLEVFENKKGYYHEGIDKAILLNLGRKYNPKYFLFMDDDELVFPTFPNVLKKCVEEGGVFSFPLVYLWGDRNKARIDAPWGNQMRTKLIPNNPNTYIPMYKCHCTAITNDKLRKIEEPILHFGYESEKRINEKFDLYKEFGSTVNNMCDEELEKCFTSKPKLVNVNEALQLKPWRD